MSFDLKHLESFVAVAETHSFSGAAQRLHTVQSAVSTHLKELEHKVGRRLVERGRGRPVSLTLEGSAFLVQARRLLMLADEMVRHSSVEEPTLRLGTTVTFALSTVAKALTNLPGSTKVHTARSHDLIAMLECNQVDAVLVFDQGPHPLRCATVETTLAWVGARSFQKDDQGRLPLAFMEDARDLRRHAFAALDKNGGFEPVVTIHPDPIGLRAVVLAGHAACLLPKPAITPPLEDVTRRLSLPELRSLPVSVYSRNQGLAMVLAQGLL